MFTTLDEIVEAVQGRPMKTVAVAVAEHQSVLEAVKEAGERSIAEAVLVGSRETIEEEAEKAGLDLATVAIIDEPNDLRAATAATELVSSGKADILILTDRSYIVLLEAP